MVVNHVKIFQKIQKKDLLSIGKIIPKSGKTLYNNGDINLLLLLLSATYTYFTYFKDCEYTFYFCLKQWQMFFSNKKLGFFFFGKNTKISFLNKYKEFFEQV